MPSPDPCPKDHVHRHGETSTCYWYGCRCDACREWIVERQFYYRSMKRAGRYTPMVVVPAIGTHRRLQALACLGWSATHVAARIGVSGQRMRQILAADRITQDNADRIAAVYDELWDQRAPESSATNRTRARAHRQGWVGPLMWDDDEIDLPEATPAVAEADVTVTRFDTARITAAVAGEPVTLSPRERREVITVLNGRRWSARRIAEYAGCDTRTVVRIRGELNLPSYDQMEIRDAA